MRKILSLRTFVVVSLLLFLATSFENTRLLAVSFHSGNPVLPWAFAGAVEVGVIGLSVGMIVRRRNSQPARGYAVTLAGVLALSVTANFLMGAQSFYPDFRILARVKSWSLWWLLPLAFSAAVPVLIFAFSELLAMLVMEDREARASQSLPRPAVGVSVERSPQSHLLVAGESELVSRVIAVYTERPETALAELARELGVSATSASRLRMRAMEEGLLVRIARGHYSPNGHEIEAAQAKGG
ncbi:MAG TPA: type IV toxin-antitoxin system AbiEi family antitoxin domain-containing protein [Anaerolineae bacterium]|nr:type IV toxin-antitoxin system AbiEi family antitoxin domain-containing protein [Anaerolineae bacterium]